ncbi:MAG TPA: M48 family metalloprotease [Kineosporiaceae bacterium]|nr:M48 family metalloprotease [Kineosporiaceae bacterium]
MHQVLEPLGYHHQVARRLREVEPATWSAFASMLGGAADVLHEPAPDPDQAAELHGVLARTAYRLDESAYPGVHAAARRAACALEIDVPIGVHQLEGSTGANATMHHLPGEVVITLGGNLLELLSDDELCAVLGHELAHRALWTAEDGAYLVADRLLEALVVDARTPPAFLETARRWSLATELFADRGALRACGDLGVTVSALAKVATGLSVVDAAAYLVQASAASPEAGSLRGSHPETVLRAWALERWSIEENDRGVQLLLSPGIDLDRLDLIDQQRLELLTRRLVGAAVASPELRGDAVVGHARRFFPDLEPSTVIDPPGDDALTASTRRYLAYVLLDLATIDPDAGDPELLAALRLADRHGLRAGLAEAIEREGVVGRRGLAGLLSAAAPAPTGAVPG